MAVSTRSRFILISVSITLLALLLFSSVIRERVIKYKHQQEIQANTVLVEHWYREILELSDLNKIKDQLSEEIVIKNHTAQVFAILDKNDNELFIFEKKGFNAPILKDIFSEIKNARLKGQVKNENNLFFWFIKELPEYKNNQNKLLIIFSLSSSTFSEFVEFFGLPFLISGLLLCWLMVWASIILSSLVVKLQNQKQALSEQAVDIEKARDDAVHANSAKSQFLANMSHEIRTPLTSIIGFAESCLDIEQTKNERLTAIKTIVRSGKHLMHIINEILDLSKIESGKLGVEAVPFSIMEVMEDVNQLVSIMAKDKGLTFSINYTFPLPEKIISDQLRLKQILLNLCSNAIKFTNEGHVYLNLSYKIDSSKLIFEVSDTGIGMTEQQIEKIFKPFEQADASTTREFGGTGLGLTLSKQLIETLNGKLYVESTLDKGSRFKAILKVKEVERGKYIYDNIIENIVAREKLLNNKPPLLTGKVLVAEDNEDIQDLVRLIFAKVGIKPDIVKNGKLAIEQAKSSDYDLVFMDIQMPVMDGLSAMKELEVQAYATPVIAMSANVMERDREEYREHGFSGFVSKPIDRNDLYSVLRQYLKPRQFSGSKNTLLTSNLLNDEPELIDLIDKFMKRLPVMRDAINKAHSDENEEELSGLIHQMKGVGGGYGYPMLTELCAKIEFQITGKDADNVNALIEELNSMVNQILDGSEENHKIAARA